jgi:FkbM family methyltransferase
MALQVESADPLVKCYEKLCQIPNEEYEAILERFYTGILCKGDTAVDVGAHVGRHTLPLAACVGDGGMVFAFEPLPHLYNRLIGVVSATGRSNIRLYDCALSREVGEAEFIHVEDAPGLSGLMHRTSQDGHVIKTIKVSLDLLDNIVTTRHPVRFIKIDAEGADFFILQGSRKILAEDRPVVVFESGKMKSLPAKSYGYSQDDFVRFFEEYRYSLYDIGGFKFDFKYWDKPTLNDFVALPVERESYFREILLASVLCQIVAKN